MLKLCNQIGWNFLMQFNLKVRVSDLRSIFAPAAPSSPPLSVRATLIEDDTALVSWKQPDQPDLSVTHYTILYASQSAWIAGEWQVLQREGEQNNFNNFRCSSNGKTSGTHIYIYSIYTYIYIKKFSFQVQTQWLFWRSWSRVMFTW